MRRKTEFNGMMEIYTELISEIIKAIKQAERKEDIEGVKEILLSIYDQGMLHAGGLYGFIHLMENKPWYDKSIGLKYLEEAAKREEPYSQFELSLIYFQGLKDMNPDPILAHYWLEKAMNHNYPPAVDEWNRRYRN